MKKTFVIAILTLATISFPLAACGGGATLTPAAPADKLAEIQERGTLIVAMDPSYPSQSELRQGAVRAAGTRCASTEYTAGEVTGFDIDVAREIARRLGVEACFVPATWTQLTSGSWGDHWDISVSSMAITPERLELLYFTQPYYAAPAALFVHRDNTVFTEPGQLSGKRIGVCAGCTYEYYLQGSLQIPDQTIQFYVIDAVIIGYDSEIPALEDLAVGDGERLDAVLTGVPLGESLMANGLPIRQLDGPMFVEYLAAAVDKRSGKDPATLVRKVTEIIQEMHGNGTLARLSQQYFGQDFATAAGRFDFQRLGQLP
jgi:polar amino acid transport system substrate-binding protein